MSLKKPCIVIFDIGKTNKKLLVFNEYYQVEHISFFTVDNLHQEHDFPVEDIGSLKAAIILETKKILESDKWDIKAINFATYGATIVHLGKNGEPVLPVLNYLTPYLENVQSQFEQLYNADGSLYAATASPKLGNLNVGMQLFDLKYSHPETFQQVAYSIFLPQYLSSIFTHQFVMEKTSLGCHTLLWDFHANAYHQWVKAASIDQVLPAIQPSATPLTVEVNNHAIAIGIGLHDSSAALIPYLKTISHPFVLLSTGSWSICMNPFNDQPLTAAELEQDCLCYLDYRGNAVKSSRLNAGFVHAETIVSICGHFGAIEDDLLSLPWDETIAQSVSQQIMEKQVQKNMFNVTDWSNSVDAYYASVQTLVMQQADKIKLVLTDQTDYLYVDGGFSKNIIFMQMLKIAFPMLKIFAAEVGQSTALGAAIVLHDSWNTHALPNNLIDFRTI
jgi:sugar (pentulose or hexulose) kinase